MVVNITELNGNLKLAGSGLSNSILLEIIKNQNEQIKLLEELVKKKR